MALAVIGVVAWVAEIERPARPEDDAVLVGIP
jgi:hypothetical protein